MIRIIVDHEEEKQALLEASKHIYERFMVGSSNIPPTVAFLMALHKSSHLVEISRAAQVVQKNLSDEPLKSAPVPQDRQG